MKSRIIPQIPETVLSYGLEEDASARLEKISGFLGMTYKAVPRDKAGETVGFLAGYGGFNSNGTALSADGQCVIFSGIVSKRLDALLAAMRREGLEIPLKAVVTAHNQSKSLQWLLEELSKEHEAVSKASRK